uniref:Membrane protein n=1 Tax=Staphylococcus phage 184DA TaxID=3110532 RepID=A0AAU6MXD2_9CAUD
MNKVLEFTMSYLLYLIIGFIGVWLGSLIMGIDINPFTSWVPYVVSLVVSVSEYIFK